MKRGQD